MRGRRERGREGGSEGEEGVMEGERERGREGGSDSSNFC